MALYWTPRGAVRPVFCDGFWTFHVSYLYRLKKPYEPSWGPTWAQHGPQEGPQIDQNRRRRLAWALPFSASMLEGLGKSIWERFGAPLGAIWGSSWASLGRSWGHLGPSRGHLGAILVPSWAILGPSWAPLGHLGAIVGHLGAIVGHRGPSWGHLGAILGPSWGHLGAS